MTNVAYTATKTLTATTKTGYTFLGWSLTDDNKVDAVDYSKDALTNISVKTLVDNLGKAVYVEGSIQELKLYAVWSNNTYFVDYDANTGSGTMTSSTHTYAVDSTLTENAFTKVGYKFTGWNTQANGEGTAYADNETVSTLVSAPNGRITLYAQWVIETYNITVTANDSDMGSVEPTSTTITYSTGSVKANITATANDGYHFKTWSVSNNNVKVADLTTATTTFYALDLGNDGATATITANFAADVYNIEYVGVHGTVTGDTTIGHNETITLTPTADNGYYITGNIYTAKVGGANYGTISGNNFTASADLAEGATIIITATFVREIYNIEYAGVHGTVTGEATIGYDDTITLIPTADTGYNFDNYTAKVGGANYGTISGNNFTASADLNNGDNIYNPRKKFVILAEFY